MRVQVNYLILGIFVIVLGVGMIYGVYWFSRVAEAVEYDTYQVYFQESVSGLSEKSPVKYNGVKVGFVDNIEISRVNFRQTIITIKVQTNTPVTDETYATIISQGITGLAYVGLKTLIPYGKQIEAGPNEPYPVIKSSPSLFVEIDQAINQVTLNLKGLATKVESILDDENQKLFKNTLKHLSLITSHLSTKANTIDKSFEKLDSFLSEFTIVAKRLPAMVEKIESTLITIESTSKSIGSSTKNFNTAMNDTSRLISDVNQQLVPVMSRALEQLDNTLTGIDSLSRDIQENPSMLVRGKYPAKLGPGEKQ